MFSSDKISNICNSLTNNYCTPIKNSIALLADTGCTSHYLTDTTNLPSHKTPLLQVQLPNGKYMHSNNATTLPFPELSQQSRKAHIFPELKSANLLSIGQLCNDGCTATFTKNTMTITKNDSIILSGNRNHNNGMWYVPLPQNHPCETANVVTKLHPTSELIKFLHAAAFSPSPSTWIKAIKAGFFSTWPNLTAEHVTKYLPKSIPTAMGHMDQERKNLRSTKVSLHETFETYPICKRTNDVYTHVLQNHIYTDQTGRFPVQSYKGHNYIMVAYDYDTNSIHAQPIKNRTTIELTQAKLIL